MANHTLISAKNRFPKFFIKFVGKKYEVVRGMKYHGCGEEYNMKKGKGEAKSSSL